MATLQVRHTEWTADQEMAVEPNKITGCTLLNPRATLVLTFF